MVSTQVVDCRSYVFVDLDLFNARIAFDVNDPIALEQVVIEFLRAADVQDGVGFAIKLPDFFERQPDCWILL